MLKKLILVLFFGLSSNAFAVSEEDFAAQVKTYEKRLQTDPAFDKETAQFCTQLGHKRLQKSEPKCVAREVIATNKALEKITSPLTYP